MTVELPVADPSVIALWGKWGNPDKGGPYPLLAHCLDTAAVSASLWDNWMSEPLHDALIALFGNADAARSGFILAAGLHDVGKANPLFQGQSLNPTAHHAFGEHLHSLNLPPVADHLLSTLPPNEVSGLRSFLRHESMSAHIVSRCDLPIVIAVGVGGHHGRYTDRLSSSAAASAYVSPYWAAIDESDWVVHQNAIINAVQTALGVHVNDVDPDSTGFDAGASIPLFSGLISLADWVASEYGFLRHRHLRNLSDPETYYEARMGEAAARLRTVLGNAVTARGRTFHDLWPGYEPRPVQELVDTTDHGPGLTVMMVPMGEGKTEAALRIHADRPDLREGLLFALPTTATADAMFERILDFYRECEGYARLQHSRALLNAFYEESSSEGLAGICDHNDTTTQSKHGLVPSDFMNGAHRGTLAPVTVSTCDQVLAAAVSHKYVTVRLAALAGKHLILDEVHTYDPFQQHLLERLLGWLGYYRIRVTMLSATLPSKQLNACINAYQNGWHRFPTNPPHEAPEFFNYPSVVRVDGDGITVTDVASDRQYTHHLTTLRVAAETPEDFHHYTVSRVLDHRHARPHERIGVIVNTVDRAIAVSRQLQDKGENVILLHSRMTFRQREAATAAVHAAIGKNSVMTDPVTIVATQIAEASLDIDFDYLFTDLAPMSSMLQRMGRQWRHSHPNPDGSWTHPAHLSYRHQNGPTTAVLVWTSIADALHPQGLLPYTMAELSVTYKDAHAMNSGNRTSLNVPHGMQAAVDATYVSFEQLMEEEHDSVTALEQHLAKVRERTDAASLIGVPVKDVFKSWRRNPDPTGNPHLQRLTEGAIWAEEHVTRFRDRESVSILMYDPTGKNPHAYPHDLSGLRGRLDRQALVEVLSYAASVTPTHTILDEIKAHEALAPEWWAEDTPRMLSSIIPINVNKFTGYELTEEGLVRP